MAMTQKPEDVFWYLHLKPTQEKALEELTAHLELAGVAHEDKLTLLRFLKARQWDVLKAAVMYKEMLHWREGAGGGKMVDTFVEYPEYHDVQACYPHFYHKTDKFGRPLYIELLGIADPAKLLSLSPITRFMEYHVYCWERLEQQLLPACSLAAGKPIITTCVIIDLSRLSMKNFTMQAQNLIRGLAKVDQDYFPEHLGQMFIINTPFVFKAIWAVVYTMLEERTRKKIIVLGSDFKAKLLEVVPLENLPVFLGGTSMCADFKSSIGPWTDKSEGACMSPSNSQLSLWTMGKGISPATPTDSPVAPETARVQVAV